MHFNKLYKWIIRFKIPLISPTNSHERELTLFFLEQISVIWDPNERVLFQIPYLLLETLVLSQALLEPRLNWEHGGIHSKGNNLDSSCRVFSHRLIELGQGLRQLLLFLLLTFQPEVETNRLNVLQISRFEARDVLHCQHTLILRIP